jgi:CheY-like chemotaxis protein
VLTEQLPTSEALSSSAGRARVLLVEDERVARRALAALLSASGYPTDAVASAEEALSVLGRETPPRIALIDFNLPGMSGLDLIDRLERFNPDVHPVIITAQGGETLRNLLRDRGVDYLQKPLNFDRLLTLLSAHQTPQ